MTAQIHIGIASTIHHKILAGTIYPNPFNPETNLNFEFSKTGNVLLEIYNIKGQKVTTLVDEPYKTGSHKIIWMPKIKVVESIC